MDIFFVASSERKCFSVNTQKTNDKYIKTTELSDNYNYWWPLL